MARPIDPKKIYRYSNEFKTTGVKLSQMSGVQVQHVAEALALLAIGRDMSDDGPKSDVFAQRRRERGLLRLREGHKPAPLASKENHGLLLRSRKTRFSGFFYSLVRQNEVSELELM